MNDIAIRVEAVTEHGMATIWECRRADLGGQPDCRGRDAGLRTSRFMAARPRESSPSPAAAPVHATITA